MLERGDAASAAPYFERALEGDPRFADAHFNLAMAFEQLGERARARPHWKQVPRPRAERHVGRRRARAPRREGLVPRFHGTEGCSAQQASAAGERKGDKKIGKIRKVEGAAARGAEGL